MNKVGIDYYRQFIIYLGTGKLIIDANEIYL